jgi:hypothetical protein
MLPGTYVEIVLGTQFDEYHHIDKHGFIKAAPLRPTLEFIPPRVISSEDTIYSDPKRVDGAAQEARCSSGTHASGGHPTSKTTGWSLLADWYMHDRFLPIGRLDCSKHSSSNSLNRADDRSATTAQSREFLWKGKSKPQEEIPKAEQSNGASGQQSQGEQARIR